MANLNQTIDRSLQISRERRRRLRAASPRSHAGVCGPGPQGAGDVHPGRRAGRAVQSAAGLADWFDYGVDYAQRSALFWDTLRQRGNNWIAHEEAGKPPVLAYKYEVLADGRTLRAAGQSRAGAHHSAAGRRRRRPHAAVHHHRPARRPRPGHRRLQGGLRSRRGAFGRPSGVLRHLLSGSRSRARRSPMSPTPKPSSCASSPSGIPTARSRCSSATARAAGR